ncbi:MAG: hypothetical protein U0835_26325 [Isosphaeraceae bacterium]
MNKTTLAILLGAGLALGLGSTTARAAATPIYQTLSSRELPAATFNSLFTPITDTLTSNFSFDGVPGSAGTVQSQVFQGTGAAAGLFAYAYQIAANSNVSDSTGNPVTVDSLAFKFNSTPLGTDLTGVGSPTYSYLIKDGSVGNDQFKRLDLPGTQAPTTLSWSPGKTTGAIRAMYADPNSQTSPINAGSSSATFVLLSKEGPSNIKPTVNIGSTVATVGAPQVYTTSPGTIGEIPVPEPATWLAWSGMVAAFAMVRQFRKSRVAVA